MPECFSALFPWTLAVRSDVREVARNMARLDHEEIFGLRPQWHKAENVVQDIAALVASRAVLDGFVAYRAAGPERVPVAVALAFRDAMPRVANIAFFGREGHARSMPGVYREIARRMAGFGRDHGIKVAQVPILTAHRAARRMARSLGAQETFNYGPVGTNGQSYTHTIWRL